MLPFLSKPVHLQSMFSPRKSRPWPLCRYNTGNLTIYSAYLPPTLSRVYVLSNKMKYLAKTFRAHQKQCWWSHFPAHCSSCAAIHLQHVSLVSKGELSFSLTSGQLNSLARCPLPPISRLSNHTRYFLPLCFLLPCISSPVDPI